MRRQKDTSTRVAVITVLGVVSAALIAGIFQLLTKRTPELVPHPVPRSAARLEGMVINRSGSILSDVSVSIRNGPETRTDMQGQFVLNNAPVGDQVIVIKPPSGSGQLTQNVQLSDGQTTKTNIIYDTATSRLGLLSIVAPVDEGSLELRQVNGRHQASIFGRCDGLTQILEDFEVWVLVKSETDPSFWVQHPPAIVDPNTNTWRADAMLGDAEHRPYNGQHWTIVAVAANSDAGINRLASTPRLKELPPHIASNVVTVTASMKAAQQSSVPQHLRVTGDHRRDVYETPNGTIIGKVEPDTTLKVLDVVQVGSLSWYQVKFEKGEMYTLERPINTLMTGWVSQLAVTAFE